MFFVSFVCFCSFLFMRIADLVYEAGWSDGVMEWWVGKSGHLPMTPSLQHSIGFAGRMQFHLITKLFFLTLINLN